MAPDPNSASGSGATRDDASLKAPSKDLKKKDEDLSEEDLALKHQLELCVERVVEADPGLQKVALESMRQEIRTSTSSMTSVPKPLKFLRPHYRTLKAHYETMETSDVKKLLADILSVLALTMSAEGERFGASSVCVDHTKMNEENDDKWNNLPVDLLIALTERLDFPENIKFSAVCKSWKAATFISEVTLPKAPYLFLAEGTRAAPTVDDNDSDDDEEDSDDDEGDGESDDDEENHNAHVDGHEDINYEVPEEGNNEVVNLCYGEPEVADGVYDQGLYNFDGNKSDDVNNDKVINARGMFCLSTAKTYNIELPEAHGKLILGTNKGWLITLGRDLKINLLHPFSKKQIPLPPMLTFRTQYDYDDDFTPESYFDMFIAKVAMSSKIPTNDDDNRSLPVVMAIYGEYRTLAFAKPGDKQWIDVNIDSKCFQDIVFHKNKFYAVTCQAVFMCEIDEDDKGGLRGTKIAPVPVKNHTDYRWCLAESSSGHDLLLIVRFRKGNPYRSQYTRKYYTSEFLLWKMEQTCLEHDELRCWIPVTNLGNESLFIGKTSSFFVSSSETIKSNCIYFTDDSEFFNICKGGAGHDMGIFSLEHRTIESHFTGKSRHPFSPPLWYI